MNPPQSKCLGVFGLSLYTTEADLRGVMSKYGRVESVNVVIDQKVSFYSVVAVSWGQTQLILFCRGLLFTQARYRNLQMHFI